MKKRILRFMVCVVALTLVGGMGGISHADDAAEIVIQVSYPSGEDYVTLFNGGVGAITDAETDHYVNVHITLLDANGEPATLGPDGDPLSVVEATLTTELGVEDSIVENRFLSDTATLNFDEIDVGPAARAHIKYACQNDVPSGNVCEPGTDTLEVTVGSLTTSAEVEVKAPPADGLMARTLGVSGVRPSDLFEDLSVAPYLQSHNGLPASFIPALAGSDIYFEVWAVEGTAFTTAPELDGAEVTVSAYADYDADGTVGSTPPGVENTAVATEIVEINGGVATGTLNITAAGTLDDGANAQLKVVLTGLTGSGASAVGTEPAIAATDSNVDWVGMVPQIRNKLVIGKDVSDDKGNLVEEVETWSVLDDNTSGPTTNDMAVFVVDTYGNPTVDTVEVKASLSGSLVAQPGTLEDINGPIPETAVTGGTAWDITASVRSNTANDGVMTIAAGSDNFQEATGDGPTQATLLLEDESLIIESDSATINLVRVEAGTSNLDLHLDTDHSGTDVTAGEEVTLYITDSSGSAGTPTTSEIVEYRDELKIRVEECSSGTALRISAGNPSDDSNAVTELELTAPPPEQDESIQIPITIWGECTQSETVSLCVYLTDEAKGIEDIPLYNLPGNRIVDLQPAAESQIKISNLPFGCSGGPACLDADPIVITSQFQIATDYSLLTPASVDTADAYGNVINGEPGYGTSTNGVGTVITADRATTIRFDADDVGQTATVTVSSGSLPDRHLEIGDIVAATLAGTLMCELEGPAVPVPGGEAIVRVGADGTFTPTPKDISVDIVDASSVADSQLRNFDGDILALPASDSLASDEVIRLVVSAPEAGDVVLEVGDASGHSTLLDTGTCTINFGAACTPVVTVTPASATIDEGGTQEFTASTSCTEGGDPLNTPVYTWEISASGGTGGTGGGACSGGSISATTLNSVGLYTAPSSVSADCSDGIKATDTANDNAEGTANVTVEGGVITTTTTISTTTTIIGTSLEVRPNAITRGPVLLRFYLLRLRGINTSFSRESVVSVNPGANVELGVKLRLGQLILQMVRVPSGDEVELITLTVTTGTEVVSADVAIGLGGILSE